MQTTMWIYEHDAWTNFTWDASFLSEKLGRVRHKQGRLLGKMERLGLDIRRQSSLKTLTNDVLKSTAIEGEHLNMEEVRSSLARRLGIDMAGLIPSSRSVDGIVELMLDATQSFETPLTKERLLSWHAALFPTGYSGLRRITVGKWRTLESGAMQVVSGPIGREKIHFEALSADKIDHEMDIFLDWFQKSEMDSVLKAGISHLWFVTIHPFEDGNGRIARAICDMALSRSDGTCDRFYSLSSQIESERKDYYAHLEKQQRGQPDLTEWLDWFLGCLDRALCQAEKTIEGVLFKAELWSQFSQKPLNERQRLIISRMLEDDFQGYMNTSKYAKLAKCSSDTALRDIQDLKERGLLIQNPGMGRSTSYRIAHTLDLRRT